MEEGFRVDVLPPNSGWRESNGLLWFSAAEVCFGKQAKKKEKEKGKRRGVGALTAEELRRDGLIAPSGCGQDREGGDKGRGYSSRRAQLFARCRHRP